MFRSAGCCGRPGRLLFPFAPGSESGPFVLWLPQLQVLSMQRASAVVCHGALTSMAASSGPDCLPHQAHSSTGTEAPALAVIHPLSFPAPLVSSRARQMLSVKMQPGDSLSSAQHTASLPLPTLAPSHRGALRGLISGLARLCQDSFFMALKFEIPVDSTCHEMVFCFDFFSMYEI